MTEDEIFEHFKLEHGHEPLREGILRNDIGQIPQISPRLNGTLQSCELNKKYRIILCYDPTFPHMAYQIIEDEL